MLFFIFNISTWPSHVRMVNNTLLLPRAQLIIARGMSRASITKLSKAANATYMVQFAVSSLPMLTASVLHNHDDR